MSRILVIEDEPVMADAVADGLRRLGHAVDVAADGEEGLFKAEFSPYDVIVLDRDLPKVHGDTVCEELSDRGYTARVLMLTAAGTLDDRVEGLRAGADDYLPKPFAFIELTERIKALLRRPETRVASEIRVGGLVIDRGRRRVWRDEREIALSAKEFGVLLTLAMDPGVLVSSEELLEKVWDENADPFTNAVRVTMVGLRRKLGDPPLISTLRGVGYRLDAS